MVKRVEVFVAELSCPDKRQYLFVFDNNEELLAFVNSPRIRQMLQGNPRLLLLT